MSHQNASQNHAIKIAKCGRVQILENHSNK